MLSSAPICMLISILMLILFCIGFSIYAKSHKDNGPTKIRWAAGILLGGMAIGFSYFKIRCEGVAFDFRTVMLCLSGLFFGTIPTAIATLMATATAIIQGYGVLASENIVAECIYTIAAGATGIIFHNPDNKNIKKSAITITAVGIIVHLIMALCIYTTYHDIDSSTIQKYSIIVLAIMPIATILTGLLINSQTHYLYTLKQYHMLEDKYYKLMLCEDDVFWEFDTAGKVTYVSANVTQVLGYQCDELIDRMPHYFIEDVESVRLITEYGNQIDQPGEGYFRHDLVLKHKQGNNIYCDTRCMKIIDKTTQKAEGFVCMTRNVTNSHIHAELSRHNQKFIREQTSRLLDQQKQIAEYKQRLTQANNDIDAARKMSRKEAANKMTMLANICHEMIPSIDDIHNYTCILRDPSLPEADRNKIIDQTIYTAEFLVNISNDLIDADSITKGQTKLTISINNIENVLTELCDFHNSRNTYLLKKSIIMQYNIDLKPDEKIIKIDIIHLKRIVDILLTNAYTFTNAGQITVECAMRADSELTISVADTGIGIPEYAHQYIFKKFDDTAIPSYAKQNMYKASGLGLSLVKSLVDLMGGHIWFVSGVGRGTTISFTIPVAKAGEIASQQADTQYKWQNYAALVATTDRYTSILTCETLNKTRIKYHCKHIDPSYIDKPANESSYVLQYDVIITDHEAAKTPQLQAIAKKYQGAQIITIDNKTAPSALCKQIDQYLTKKT
ncbi:MAG: PAS domain S-box protein [Bacteroidales bacterium]|nr:PAS domain S-box protein [Bacteroidales bacterium]